MSAVGTRELEKGEKAGRKDSGAIRHDNNNKDNRIG